MICIRLGIANVVGLFSRFMFSATNASFVYGEGDLPIPTKNQGDWCCT